MLIIDSSKQAISFIKLGNIFLFSVSNNFDKKCTADRITDFAHLLFSFAAYLKLDFKLYAIYTIYFKKLK